MTERVRQEQARSKAAERTRQEDSRWKDGQSLAGKRKPSKRQKVKAAGQDAFKRTASANLGGGGASTAGIASVAARSGASSRAAVRDENGRAFESFSALDDAGQQGARRPPPQHVEKTNDQLRREAWARRDVHRENQERVGQFKQAKQDRRQQTQSQKVNEEQRQQAQLLENRRLDLQKERETWERQNERDNMEIERKKQDLANQAKRLEQQEAEKPGMAATQSKCPVCTELAYEPAFLDGHNHTDMVCPTATKLRCCLDWKNFLRFIIINCGCANGRSAGIASTRWWTIRTTGAHCAENRSASMPSGRGSRSTVRHGTASNV